MKLVIARSEGLALMKALGFPRTTEWSENKLRERLLQVPQKVPTAEVPKGFQEFYDRLCEATSIEFTGAPATSVKSAKVPKAVKKETVKKPTKEKAPAAEKPAKEKAPAAEKPAKPTKETKEKIKTSPKSRGRLVGFSAYINELIGVGMRDVGEIHEKAKIKFSDATSRSWVTRIVEHKLERLAAKAPKVKKGTDAKAEKAKS